MSCFLTVGQGRSRNDDRWIYFPVLILGLSVFPYIRNAWICKKTIFSRTREDENMRKGPFQRSAKRTQFWAGKSREHQLFYKNIFVCVSFF